jgi:hypothetical protein
MKLEQQNGHVEMLTAWGVGTLLHHSPRPLVGGRDMTHASRYLVSHWAAWLAPHSGLPTTPGYALLHLCGRLVSGIALLGRVGNLHQAMPA